MTNTNPAQYSCTCGSIRTPQPRDLRLVTTPDGQRVYEHSSSVKCLDCGGIAVLTRGQP